MITKEVVTELTDRFPGKNIVKIPPVAPKEIICEIEPSAEHEEYSVAVAVIESSKPHHHERSTETYRVLGGSMILFINDQEIALTRGEKYVVKPGNVHSVLSEPLDKPVWVEVTSEPGWHPEDHILDIPDSEQ